MDFINNAEKKILLIDDEKDITDLIEDIVSVKKLTDRKCKPPLLKLA